MLMDDRQSASFTYQKRTLSLTRGGSDLVLTPNGRNQSLYFVH